VVPEATGAAHIETPAPVAGTTRGASQLPVHYRLIEVGIGPDTVGPRQDAQGIDSKTWAGQAGRPVGCCVHSCGSLPAMARSRRSVKKTGSGIGPALRLGDDRDSIGILMLEGCATGVCGRVTLLFF